MSWTNPYTGEVNDGPIQLADAGLPSAGDESVSVSYLDLTAGAYGEVLALVLYDDRILVVSAAAGDDVLGGLAPDEMVDYLIDGLAEFYAEALEQAGS